MSFHSLREPGHVCVFPRDRDTTESLADSTYRLPPVSFNRDPEVLILKTKFRVSSHVGLHHRSCSSTPPSGPH